MSFLSDDLELEGDVEDFEFEGDSDLNEWAALGEDISDLLVSKPPQYNPSQAFHKQRQNQSKTFGEVANSRGKGHSNIFRAMGLPGSTSTKQGGPQNAKSQDNSTPFKRKASSGPGVETEEAKSRRMESDILMAIEDPGNKSASTGEVEDKDQAEQKSSFSQEELRNLDSCLVSEMMGGIKKQMFLRMAKGDRFVVTFAPVELADLAQDSMHHLIECQPNLAFFLNRQGKFKKKKGYAQAYFTLTSEVREFIDMLMHVKLSEKSTELSVSAIMNGGKHNVQVSFILSSNKKSKLMGLLESGEDPSKPVPMSSRASFQLEKVSTEATASVLMLLFPYAASINFNYEQAKVLGPGHKGPVNVYYLNQQWIDAVMACCSDFRYNGVPLNILRKEKQKSGETQKSSPQAPDTTPGVSNSSRSRHNSSVSNTSGDDDISNMTLDVCAGMMESLDKLKQMGTDNPNVLKILEMQSQLAALQKSLKKKTKQASTNSSDDPWKTGASDVSAESEPISDQSKGIDLRDRLSKDEKKKTAETEREEKNKRELAMFEAKLQEANERERDREQHLKAQVENERQRNKELEENRKRNLAKQMLEEARQTRRPGAGTSEAAQRILQSMADKRREAEQNVVLMKAGQAGRASSALYTRNTRQGANAPSFETRGQRPDFSNQVWNPTNIQEPEPMPFQETFQPMASFMDSFPGRGATIKPLTSTPRPVGPDKMGGHQLKRRSDDDGLHSRLEEFQKELAEKGVVSPVKAHENRRSAISPDRPLYEGIPVYTEKEHHCRRRIEYGHQLPQEFYIQTTFFPNRRCPVLECPNSKVFITEPMFLDHWDMFHKPTMTMRFCCRCSAYFVHPNEVHAHLMKVHNIGDHNMASSMVAEARVKVVTNPSYRDPGRFLAPPI